MKISLWGQFSSNHSANFRIMGKFQSVAAAENAAEEIRRILHTLSAWWQEQPQNEISPTFRHLRETHTLTPPEQTLKTQYNLTDFREPLDWIFHPVVSGTVKRFREWVILDQSSQRYIPETWNGAYPFNEIFRLLGADVKVGDEALSSILVADFYWTAPSVEVADAVQADFTLDYYHDFPFLSMPGINERADFYNSRFDREGLTFSLRHIYITWFDAPIEVVLEKFIGYLEAARCTDIHYDIRES